MWCDFPGLQRAFVQRQVQNVAVDDLREERLPGLLRRTSAAARSRTCLGSPHQSYQKAFWSASTAGSPLFTSSVIVVDPHVGEQPIDALLDQRMVPHGRSGALDHQEIVALGAVVIVGVRAQRIDALGHRVHAVARCRPCRSRRPRDPAAARSTSRSSSTIRSMMSTGSLTVGVAVRVVRPCDHQHEYPRKFEKSACTTSGFASR